MLACDGIWDVKNSEEGAEFVQSRILSNLETEQNRFDKKEQLRAEAFDALRKVEDDRKKAENG